MDDAACHYMLEINCCTMLHHALLYSSIAWLPVPSETALSLTMQHDVVLQPRHVQNLYQVPKCQFARGHAHGEPRVSGVSRTAVPVFDRMCCVHLGPATPDTLSRKDYA